MSSAIDDDRGGQGNKREKVCTLLNEPAMWSPVHYHDYQQKLHQKQHKQIAASYQYASFLLVMIHLLHTLYLFVYLH